MGKIELFAGPGGGSVALDDDLQDIADLSPSNDDFIQRKSGVWVNRSVAQVKTDLGVATDIAAAMAATKVAIVGLYKPLVRSSGRATAGVAATIYLAAAGASDVTAPASNVANASSVPIYKVSAADLALAGLTPKLRVLSSVSAAAAPAVTVTTGLHPVTIGATFAGQAAVAGSTAAIVGPTNGSTPGNSGDFDIPADGSYALGWTLSATPANAVVMHLVLQLHYV